MLNQNARLDVHELQIQQLQSDVAEIKASLSVLDAYRAESAEFRKVMLAWMKDQETNRADLPPKSGLSDSLGSGVDSGEVFTSSSLQSASNGDLSGDCSALLAQLEAIVSRSEARWCGHTISRSSGSSSQLPSSMVSADVTSFSAGYLGSHTTDWATSASMQGKLGLDTIVGLHIQQKMVVDLGSTSLGLITPPAFVPISVPFDRGKFSLDFYYRRSGCKGEMIPTSHRWVVHGQPRPPETLSRNSTLG
ncbi:hypothetical protein Hanom_Chr00s192859g01835571 [Helianthus anomalus]